MQPTGRYAFRTNRRSILGGALAAVALSALPAWVTGSTVADYCLGAVETECLGLINAYRQANGRGALAVSATLGAAAEHHALDMAETGTFSHTMSDGKTWLENIIAHGYPFGYRSENIGWGYASPLSIFNAWKASAGHNRNMLDPGFGAIGIQRVYKSDAPYRYFWVTTFGSQLDAAAPVCVEPSPTFAPTQEPQPTRTPKPCRGRKCRP